MKNLLIPQINQYRNAYFEQKIAGGPGDDKNGAFLVRFDPDQLAVIASASHGWDHVSVSIHMEPTRTPSWEAMDFIKRLFFYDSEVVVQFHVPRAMHVNVHPGCLHLWRSHRQEYVLPPRSMLA